jgi:integrase/recombinase XerD
MSGGKYGRGKAPQRRCLPVDLWPERDRRLWQEALTPGDVLADGGARADHQAITNTKDAKGYGRWLTYLQFNAPETLALPAEDRITAERVRAYVQHLLTLGNGTQTILDRLQELDGVARVMAPLRNWRFIRRTASRVRARHVPARHKRNMRHSDELLSLGLQLMDGVAGQDPLNAAIAYRDGLMIALLAIVPLRRRNLAGLRLGETLLRQPSQWLISFGEDDTKTHTVFETALPAILGPYLDRYLAEHRVYLEQRTGRWSDPLGNALWASKDGSPMTQIALYDRIRARTQAAFGEAMNPHLFRDAAASTLAVADPGRVRVAAPLLGHRSFKTTERHYLQAQANIGHRAYIDVLFPTAEPTA